MADANANAWKYDQSIYQYYRYNEMPGIQSLELNNNSVDKTKKVLYLENIELSLFY